MVVGVGEAGGGHEIPRELVVGGTGGAGRSGDGTAVHADHVFSTVTPSVLAAILGGGGGAETETEAAAEGGGSGGGSGSGSSSSSGGSGSSDSDSDPGGHLAACASLLSGVESSSVAVVNLGYHKSPLTVKGFGYLIPSREKEPVLGATWDSW